MWQLAGSLQLAALPPWLLIIFPLGLGRPWELKKQRINLLFVPGYGRSRKPGPANVELGPHQRPPTPRLCPWDAGVNSKEAGMS